MDQPSAHTTAGARPPTGMAATLNRLLDEAEQTGDPAAMGESAVTGERPAAGMASAPEEPTAASAGKADAPNGETAVPNGGDRASAASSPSPDGMSPLLSGLLSNPALLAAIPTLVENLSPLLNSSGHGTGNGRADGRADGRAESRAASGAASAGGKETAPAAKKYPVDRHTALICAVKPYLSPERQEAAETILRLCRIWDALGRSGMLTALQSTNLPRKEEP